MNGQIYLPKSGSEPVYVPDSWNTSKENVQKTHNCYAYFLQDLQPGRRPDFPQPGALEAIRQRVEFQKMNRNNNGLRYFNKIGSKQKSNLYKPPRGTFTCKNVTEAIKLDNANIFEIDENKPCPYNYYKGYLAVDEGDVKKNKKSDYHFWVQNKNGLWSHKPGKNAVTNVDSEGKLIANPRLSARGRYKSACSYFCVPSNKHEKTDSAPYDKKKIMMF